MIAGSIAIAGTVYRQICISMVICITAVRHYRHWYWKYRRLTSLVIIVCTSFFVFTPLGSHVSFPLVLTDWFKRFSANGICYIDLIMFYTPKCFTESYNIPRQQWNLYLNIRIARCLLTDVQCKIGSFTVDFFIKCYQYIYLISKYYKLSKHLYNLIRKI